MGLYFNKTDYPNLDLAIIGSLKNKGYGQLESIQAHGIVAGATSLLVSTITSSGAALTVADASRYPPTPFTIQINAERMRVTLKAGAVFTVTRGYDNTEPAAHVANQTVFEALTEYVYLLNDGAIKQVDAIYIDGIKQNSANYTVYTGQAGDAHADWPGVAVISFSASAYIEKQFNFDTAAASTGDIKTGRVDFASHAELSTVDYEALTPDTSPGLFGVTIGNKGAGVLDHAFVKFLPDYGNIIKQRYYIDVQNTSAALKTIHLDVIVAEGDEVKLSTPFSITKNESITLEVSRTGGTFDDVLKIHSYSSDIVVKNMRKDVYINPEAYQPAGGLTLTQEIIPLHQILINAPVRRAVYSPVALGASIVKQTHIVELIDSLSGDEFIELSISAVEKTGTVIASENFILTGSSTFYGSLTHDAGSYDTSTVVAINNNPLSAVEKVKIKKIIEYTTTALTIEGSLAATSSGKVVVGSIISADAKFAVDMTGDYGGSGTLIQRPDWVIKHYLVNEKGAALADIDTTSFSSAGALYTGAAYELNFLRSLSIDEDQMAYECRSVVYMTQGKYYLDVIVDASPAGDMIIYEADIIGAIGFTYDHGKIEDLHTDYTARYGLNGDGTWAGVVTAVDVGNKYGTRIKSIDLPLIRAAGMAQSVLNHILLQHKELYATVKFTVSWKYQALQIGDTFEVSCSLYPTATFFVEKLKINDDNTIYVEGRQWW